MTTPADEIEPIKCLNHGVVRLVDYMGSDLSIVRAARTSYDAAWRAGSDQGGDARLINYLYKNGHSTPFEAVTLTFEVKAPIFVFRQWHRHRTQSYNELSARYRPLPEEYYVPLANNITTQSTGNKQMRTEEVHPHAETIQDMIQKSCKSSYAEYQELLDMGCPRELARGVLPFNMYSHMFTTMNLHNLMRFLSERTHLHAQWEIRVFAEAMRQLAHQVAPVAMSAWEDHHEHV